MLSGTRLTGSGHVVVPEQVLLLVLVLVSAVVEVGREDW